MGLEAVTQDLFKASKLTSSPTDIRFMLVLDVLIIHLKCCNVVCIYLQPLTHVCAKNLATFVSQEASNRPVLLGLALKDSSIDAIKQMKDLIRSCQVW